MVLLFCVLCILSRIGMREAKAGTGWDRRAETGSTG